MQGGEKQGKVSKLSKGEVLMLNIGSMCTGARVVAVSCLITYSSPHCLNRCILLSTHLVCQSNQPDVTELLQYIKEFHSHMPIEPCFGGILDHLNSPIINFAHSGKADMGHSLFYKVLQSFFPLGTADLFPF